MTMKIQKLQKQWQEIHTLNLSKEVYIMNKRVESLKRDLSRWIVHVDMDSFYASVEELDRPELKTKPMAVGGMSMLSTANYEARKYGVRSAMPGYIAKKLCPELIILSSSFDKYNKACEQIRNVFSVGFVFIILLLLL